MIVHGVFFAKSHRLWGGKNKYRVVWFVDTWRHVARQQFSMRRLQLAQMMLMHHRLNFTLGLFGTQRQSHLHSRAHFLKQLVHIRFNLAAGSVWRSDATFFATQLPLKRHHLSPLLHAPFCLFVFSPPGSSLASPIPTEDTTNIVDVRRRWRRDT